MKLIFSMAAEIDLASVNNKYVNRSYVLTKEYRTFKNEMTLIARFFYKNKTPSLKSVYVTATVYTRKNVDNMIKPTLDALEGIVYKNDDQINDVHFHREKKVNKQERIEIQIFEVDE
jgi:Holliday junction resolvase RusA-like endonuclease